MTWASQVLAAAPPLQQYFVSAGQLTKGGLLGGAMRELLEASTGTTAGGAECPELDSSGMTKPP